MCLRVAKRFQDVGVEVRIIGFPDKIDGAGNSASQKSWVYDGVEICELRRGSLEDCLLRAVPYLKKRRATFPLARLFFEWAYAKQISRLCQGSQVFHYFGTGTEMIGYAVAMAARAVGAKLLVEPAIHEETWGDSWLDVTLYQVADLLIAHTGHEARLLENFGVPKNKINTIVHGVDFCESGNGARFRKKHQISGPVVLFFGRKTKKKGISRLLEAWLLVAEKHPRATLVLAGSSIWKDDQIESFKLQHRDLEIRDLDDISEDEKQDALAACDVLCVPSEGESFGMVYYEAWAYKKPVVALDLPLFRESIGAVEGGLLTDQRPKSIASALVKFLDNPELKRRVGSNGFELAKKHDWPLALTSYLTVYRQAGVDL